MNATLQFIATIQSDLKRRDDSSKIVDEELNVLISWLNPPFLPHSV